MYSIRSLCMLPTVGTTDLHVIEQPTPLPKFPHYMYCIVLYNDGVWRGVRVLMSSRRLYVHLVVLLPTCTLVYLPCSAMVHCVPRASVCDLEVDALAVDILNRLELSMGKGCGPVCQSVPTGPSLWCWQVSLRNCYMCFSSWSWNEFFHRFYSLALSLGSTC